MLQEVLFDRLRGQYGVSTAAMMKITVEDKVRIAGLVITKAPLHEYLSDLTGRSTGCKSRKEKCRIDTSP